MKKLVLIMLFISSGLFAQDVYEFTFDGVRQLSDSVGLGRNDVPMCIFSNVPITGDTIWFYYSEDSDSLLKPMKNSNLALVYTLFEDSTYIDLDHMNFLGAISTLQLKSNAVEDTNAVIKIGTAPLK